VRLPYSIKRQLRKAILQPDDYPFLRLSTTIHPHLLSQFQSEDFTMFSSRAFIRATRASAPRSVIVPQFLPGSAFRAYATTSNTPDPKPPVALYGLDGTYASALVGHLPSKLPDG
jgi:hypothetical protein